MPYALCERWPFAVHVDFGPACRMEPLPYYGLVSLLCWCLPFETP